jgi:hypothetical protein
MKSQRPDDGYLKAFAARARLRERGVEQRNEARKTRLRWAVWAFGLLLLIGLLADLRNISSRLGHFQRTGSESRQGDAADILAGLDGPRYEDPSGWFSLVPPRHWVRVPESPDSHFTVLFRGPYGMDMGIQVVATNGLTFDRLVENLRDVERRLAANLPMEFAYVGPHRAIKRSAQLFKSRILMLDFVTGHLAHHVQFSMPPALYDEYEPVFLRLMQTYEPGRILPAN